MKNGILTNPHTGFPMTTWAQRIAAVRLLRIIGVVDDGADSLSHRAAFAGVERHQARGCHVEKQNGLPKQTANGS